MPLQVAQAALRLLHGSTKMGWQVTQGPQVTPGRQGTRAIPAVQGRPETTPCLVSSIHSPEEREGTPVMAARAAMLAPVARQVMQVRQETPATKVCLVTQATPVITA